MFMTKEQFIHQDVVWGDNYYLYAIHKTDGGAVYLLQTTLENFASVDNNTDLDFNFLRLDGADTTRISAKLPIMRSSIDDLLKE